ALVAALAWLSDQPSLAPRADHLFEVVASAILTSAGSSDAAEERRPRARS
ncbi:TetR family transcriptional regulator, partial [Streptomyces mirabilis]